jgi:alkylation response protein AidB-like acyl-CoA dehydrogenase
MLCRRYRRPHHAGCGTDFRRLRIQTTISRREHYRDAKITQINARHPAIQRLIISRAVFAEYQKA